MLVLMPHAYDPWDVPRLGNEPILDGALEALTEALDEADSLRRQLRSAKTELEEHHQAAGHGRWPWSRAATDSSREPSMPHEAGSADDAGRVTRLVAAGEHGQASALALAALRRAPHDADLLRAARIAFSRSGALSLALRCAEMLQELEPTPQLVRQVTELRARVEEMSSDWRPFIRGDAGPLSDPVPGRVLHLLKVSLPHRQSGYTVRTRYTLAAQQSVGLEPIAVTSLGFPRIIGETEFAPVEDVLGVPHYRLDLGEDTPSPSSPSYLDAYAEAAAAVVRETRPTVIHAHSGHRGYETALVALALGRKYDIPVVYEVRGFFEALWTSDPRWAERGELFERRKEIEDSCFRESAAVVTLSEGMRAEIHSRGVPAEKVVAVPNGVDPSAFSPRARNEDLVRELGLEGFFTFGYISNLDHYREGHELLVQAAAALRDRGVRAKCLIVGEGKRRDMLEQLAKDSGVEDLVLFTGKVPHTAVLDYYALLDAFVIPRVPERAARLVTPLKPFEAMACGIPLVVSELEALTEIIGGDRRGRSFPPGDAGALADVLQELAETPGRADELARCALEWVRSERDWVRNGSTYADVYAKVATAWH
jgi:glycosyltransferase involved in cell wall biosynthesis